MGGKSVNNVDNTLERDRYRAHINGVLQCIAVFCSVLQRIAVCCSVLQYIAKCCRMLQSVAVCYRVL